MVKRLKKPSRIALRKMGFRPLSWSYWFYDKTMYIRFPETGLIFRKSRSDKGKLIDISLNPLADRIYNNFMKG